MFTNPKVNVVSSDEGFCVEILGRTGIGFREDGKSVFVDSEIGGHGIAVFKDSIKVWQPPNDKEQISSEQKQRIVENIRKAMEFLREPVEVL